MIKICLAIFVVIGALLGLLAILAVDSGPELAFAFLDGRTLKARIEEDPGKRFYSTTREVYSFAADVNDVCKEADGELSAMGFKVLSLAKAGISDREYRLGDHSFANSWTSVRIPGNTDINVHSRSGSEGPGFHWYHREGWVCVQVLCHRLRSWPPRNFLIRLQLMLHRVKTRAARNKRTQTADRSP